MTTICECAVLPTAASAHRASVDSSRKACCCVAPSTHTRADMTRRTDASGRLTSDDRFRSHPRHAVGLRSVSPPSAVPSIAAAVRAAAASATRRHVRLNELPRSCCSRAAYPGVRYKVAPRFRLGALPVEVRSARRSDRPVFPRAVSVN